MPDYHINIAFSEEDGGYIADIPDLEACSAFGKTADEALRQVEIAKEAWLAAAKASYRPVPPPSYRLVICQSASPQGQGAVDETPKPRTLFNRFLWSAFIVLACSAMSFFVALDHGYPALAMLPAIAGFVACYVTIWSSAEFNHFLSRRGMSATFKTAYILRILFIAAFPVSLMVDLEIGSASIELSRKLGVPRPFFTGVTTIIDGLIQHTLLAFLMIIVYPFARMSAKPSETARGFEVLPVARSLNTGIAVHQDV